MAEGAYPVNDQVPKEIEISYDIDHQTVEKKSIFPTMLDCRRAVKQWAINEEFNLGVYRDDKSRWMAYCTEEDCPWKITCRLMADKTKTWVPTLFFTNYKLFPIITIMSLITFFSCCACRLPK